MWKTELPFGHSSPILTEDRIYLTAVRRRASWSRSRSIGRAAGSCGSVRRRGRAPRSWTPQRAGRPEPGGGRHGYLRLLRRLRRLSPTTATARSGGACRSARSTTSTAWARRQCWSTIWSSWSATRAPTRSSSRSTRRRGAVRWKTARPEAHSGHSTPILYQPAGGGMQILAPGSFQLTAYDVNRREGVVGAWALVRAQVDAGRQRRHPVHQRLRFAGESARRAAEDPDRTRRSWPPTTRMATSSCCRPNCRRNTAARGSIWTATVPSRPGMGLLPGRDGLRERHARDSPRRPRRRHGHQRGAGSITNRCRSCPRRWSTRTSCTWSMTAGS